MRRAPLVAVLAAAALACGPAHAVSPAAALAASAALDPALAAFYIDLHRNPELSLHEEKT